MPPKRRNKYKEETNMETAYLRPKTKLAGNIQAAMAETLKNIVENRGGAATPQTMKPGQS